jgi:hypothetical protein
VRALLHGACGTYPSLERPVFGYWVDDMDTCDREKQCGQLDHRADLLMRSVDVARRNERRRLLLEVVRRIIRVRLHDGSLPYDGIPATTLGRRGDNSPCAACDHEVTGRQLMMVFTPHASRRSCPIPFHVGCFEQWNEERKAYKTDLMQRA